MADQVFAVNSGFYDAVNSDRTYSADDMNRPYKRVVSNGVFATPKGTKSTDLQVVSANNGMQIIVKKGEGIFADKWFENPAAINITVPANTSTVPRIDSVIVQVDKRTSGRVGNIVYRAGTPSVNPVAPSINTVSNVTEYRLANIRVETGTTAITTAMITDRRGSSDCPWITSLIYQVDTSVLYDQWAAAYEEYFEAEKDMWDDWYSHLTEELDVSMTLIKHTSTFVTTQETSEITIGISDFNANTDMLEVYINGMRAIEGSQYTINGNTGIILSAPLGVGQTVNFVCLKSVIMGNLDDITHVIEALEERIASITGGVPTVVDSASAMTDTDKIYILTTDSKWYYYNLTSSAWVAGGVYGGVPTDTTLTQSGMPADAKAVGDEITDLKEDLNAITDNVSTSLTGTVTSAKTINYLKQIVNVSTAYYVSQYDVVAGSSLSVNGCASNYGYLYIFTDENDSVVGQSEQNGSGMKNYSAVETVVPQGAVKIIVASHTSTSYTQAEVTVHELIVKGVEELDGKVSALETLVDDDPVYLPVAVIEKANFFVSGSIGSTPTETTHENWRILSAPVIWGQKYRVSADYYSSVKGVFFTDVNNKIVEIDGEENTDTLHTIDVTVPPTAIKISINDKKSIGFSLSQIIYPIDNDRIIIRDSNIEDLLGGISEKVAVMSGSSQYTVGTGKMKTVVWLNGSQNGTVAYRNIEYNGSVFKEASDDVTPVQTDAGYVGANHGYYLVYDATLANHGLTESDIGKTCTINGETWVLIKIKSTSVFVVGCVDATSVYGLKAVETAPTQFNFGSSITVTNIARSQLRPSVKNIKVNITKNNAEAFEIAESYDIVLLGDGIDYIIDNVGNNTNDSVIYNSAPAITIRNLYVFGANGSCAIIQNCKMINDDIVLNYYGGTQSGGFGDTDYFAVPMTSYGALASAGVNTNFSRDTWDDNAKPPIIYCQADNTPNSANKMMVQGVVMTDRNDAIYSSAGFIYTTSKMYPYALQLNSAQDANKTYSLISFRMPIYANEISDDFKFCQYCKVLDDYYFFCFSTGVKSASIYVPEALTGRKVETIVAKNALCHNALVTDVIDVTSTGESFLLLKLTR